jgi:hypothetical protein
MKYGHFLLRMRFKNMFAGCAFLTVLITFAPGVAHASEYIESFIANIEVETDGTFTVTENIVYVFDVERHGIERCIPTLHQDAASSIFKEQYIDIEVRNVRMDEKSITYDVKDGRSEVCVKIGDPNNTITGVHLFELSYTVGGAITYQEFGGAELYWNVTGNGWEVPMRFVEARVSSSESIFLRERACYRGVFGKTDASCDVREGEGGVVNFSGRNFGPGEGLTLAQALDRSKIAIDIRERYKLFAITLVVVLTAVGGLGVALYRYKTKFKTDKPIIPQYEPYEGVKPMYMGYLFDKRLDPRDIAAGILYLAERGYLRIKRTEKKAFFIFEVDDYEITLVKPLDEQVGRFEKRILSLIFKKYSPDSPPFDGVQKASDQSGTSLIKFMRLLNKGPFLKNRDTTLAVGASTRMSELRGSATENAVISRSLTAELLEDVVTEGYFTSSSLENLLTKNALLAGLAIFFIAGVIDTMIATRYFLFIFLGVVLLVLFLSSGRRTRRGYEALNHLKGFKDYLRVTDKERFIFHNAPEKNAEQFMEYLPYAIAFGVETQWAKTFEGLTIPNPSWYDGGSAASFSAVSLSQSLGGFSSALTSVSGTGGSASSGGGFSGGGSGGGGGGSW